MLQQCGEIRQYVSRKRRYVSRKKDHAMDERLLYRVTTKERPPGSNEIWVFFLMFLHFFGQIAINQPFLHKIWTVEDVSV